MKQPHIVSVRQQPAIADTAIRYFQDKWANPKSLMVYEDCIRHCIGAQVPLPQWYLLFMEDAVIGCAGLITNDFISRMDLDAWLCALYIEPAYRGRRLGEQLIGCAVRHLRAEGAKRLVVQLPPEHPARGFFRYFGFAEQGSDRLERSIEVPELK